MKFLTLIIFSFFSTASNLKITPTDFSLPTYKNKETITYKELKNKKKGIVLNFWATWCTSCISELPDLKALKNSAKYKDYIFYGISAGDKKKQIKKFIKKYGFPYPILMDKTKKVSKSWGVYSLPVTVIINRNGEIEYKGVRPPTIR